MNTPTLFERILAGDIPATIIHRDERCFAIHDINPQAPVHVLIIPNRPLGRIGLAEADDRDLIGHLLLTAAELARKLDLAKGYRIVINNGPDGGESVPHLHVHLLGGRQMGWPPG